MYEKGPGQKGKPVRGTVAKKKQKNKETALVDSTAAFKNRRRSSHVVQLGVGRLCGFPNPRRLLLAVLLRRFLDRKQHHHSKDRLRYHRKRPVLSAVHVCEPDEDWSF